MELQKDFVTKEEFTKVIKELKLNLNYENTINNTINYMVGIVNDLHKQIKELIIINNVNSYRIEQVVLKTLYDLGDKRITKREYTDNQLVNRGKEHFVSKTVYEILYK